MTETRLQVHAQEAIARLQHVLDRGQDVSHDEVRAAADAVVALRDCAIEGHREAAPEACLDEANALVSLIYGAEFPLSGLHLQRVAQTCEGVRRILTR